MYIIMEGENHPQGSKDLLFGGKKLLFFFMYKAQMYVVHKHIYGISVVLKFYRRVIRERKFLQNSFERVIMRKT